ncbi:glycolipid transfer protein GLTP [Besnoitia besnoiti]|uniref:Glycolipid transfer protein GLTP n=1 Tax=Besnoitia besnoiti TaxID=94643 RepID=A0A2A9MAA6_BESBE|nr:glycolipid transfer protein GLTP [Besnoitia besnoiti]PFH35398.1 glycolipid transfer protein GLTP [Besnoitia besnoiti]
MGATGEGSDLDPTKGEGLYLAVTTGFSKARAEDGRILSSPLTEAVKTIIPVYDTIFGAGMVANLLKKDLTNSSSKVREATEKQVQEEPAAGPVTVDMLIDYEVKKYGVAFLRKDANNGVKNLLWMKRALDFIIGFLENVIFKMKGKTAKECATEVYQCVLKPYHGFMVSNVVSLAFNLCPTREELCKKLGFEDEAIIEDRVHKISEVCRPLLDEMSAMLEKAGCNFPDKV